MFDSPSFAPGTGIGSGICDSNVPSTIPSATKSDMNNNLFVSFNVITHPIRLLQAQSRSPVYLEDILLTLPWK